MNDVHPLQHYPGYEQADLAVFDKFRGASPKAEEGFIVDFLGVRTRAQSLAEAQRQFSGKLLGIPVPGDFHAEAIEYIGLLKSVVAAKDRYVVMELGAGWGPWLVTGGVAARQLGITDIRMCGVEADEGHFLSMQQHLRDNGFEPARQVLLKAAVGASSGKAVFPKMADSANQWGARPAMIEGGCPAKADVDYLGALLTENVEVDVLPINELLERESLWDLVHIDVQGWEQQICTAGIDNLNQRARYLIVGTHSRKLDGDLIALFHRSGWILEHEKPTQFRYVPGASELESMTLADGTQVWRNPGLLGG